MAPALLDTHAWVWWVDRDRRLGDRALEALDQLADDDRPYLCDISLWEVATLVQRGRLSFEHGLDDWLEGAAHPRTVRIIPVMPDIAAEAAGLTATFSRDPADRLIVATSRVLRAPLLTTDRRLVQSPLVHRWTP